MYVCSGEIVLTWREDKKAFWGAGKVLYHLEPKSSIVAQQQIEEQISQLKDKLEENIQN